MKKLALLICIGVALTLTSCSSFYKTGLPVTTVNSPIIETATTADLDISPKKIIYVYVPEKSEATSLSTSELLNNAIFNALRENGYHDALVEMNYQITTRRGLFSTRITKITVSGYPADYMNFRKPNDEDRRNIQVMNDLRKSTVQTHHQSTGK